MEVYKIFYEEYPLDQIEWKDFLKNCAACFDKVVSSAEQRRVEELAIKGGINPAVFNQAAGKAVAVAIERYCKKQDLPHVVHALIGKGNNGKDGQEALIALSQMGFQVYSNLDRLEKGVILDALYGIGFHGEIKGEEAEAVEKANQSGLKIIALDIPSGVNGTSGQVSKIHIEAAHTIAVGTYKMGHILEPGYLTYQTIELVSFGLGAHYYDQLEEVARVVRLADLEEPTFPKKIHKYQRGYVGVIAGSKQMEGAAYLVAKAALETGAGMVRLFVDEDFRLPLVEAVYAPQTLKALQEYAPKLDALVIGPGMDLLKKPFIEEILTYLIDHPIPLIVDAGAIGVYLEMKKRPFAMITPNGSEIKYLKEGAHDDCILYKKGPPTWIFDPQREKPYIILEADPKLATAGTGDVLSGMMGAYLARTGSYFDAALLASRRLIMSAASQYQEFPTSSEMTRPSL
ncbi:MAG: bifunctional ADP-dependent NAD(P)H-hydrate dehydratase/NAD(P)H-hydrate epimerase [Chlamydiia bacterium]